MTTREEALEYGMSFPDVYVDTPFHDPNWVLVRSRKNKRAFLWTYEYQGQMRINVKADRFLAESVRSSHSGLSSEQKALEYGHP